jgi:undecaprenyl-diphosphatase
MLFEDLISALILAVVQGATEWFPVSSSGHLVLVERLLGFEGGLLLEVALHFGTLMAVFVYFGKDITEIVRHFFSGQWDTEHGRMGWLLIVGSVPAAIVGFFVADFFDSVFSGFEIVALGFGITGLFLVIVSSGKVNSRTVGISYGKKVGRWDGGVRAGQGDEGFGGSDGGVGTGDGGLRKLGFGKALLIGVAQAFAIVPGISRSGATVTSGILLGLSERNAMRFGFIMSIPVIFGANILVVGSRTLPSEMIWATLVSFLVGLLSIHVVFRYVLVSRKNFRWFGIYCLLLALALGVYLFLSY